MNGNEMGEKPLSARDMTAEIDRAAELMVNQQQNAAKESLSNGLDRVQAGSFGNKVLTYNPNRQAELNNERVHAMAEIDNGYAPEGLNNALTVGEESNIQAEERLAEDREDIANEQGLNGVYVKNIMDRNNKRITKETVTAVDKMIAENEMYPWKLDRLANSTRIKFLKDVFNRILGSRNG